MKSYVLVLATILWGGMPANASSSPARASPPSPKASSCLKVAGIVSGGGKGMLDLDVVRKTVEKEPFDLGLKPIPTTAACSSGLETPVSMRNLLAIDTAAFSVSEMFHPNPTALDIFGDMKKSNARRRCQPAADADPEEAELLALHLRIAIMYLVVYGGLKGMPYCYDTLEKVMAELSVPIDLIFDPSLDTDPALDTPWGLAKAYVDDTFQYMLENDGWNADGSMSRSVNKIPFSDYAYTDSKNNSWEPYKPRNSPWKFSELNSWQPLTENNELGYITTQMHVTPHIGATARFYGFDTPEAEAEFATRTLPTQVYDYADSAKQVLESSRVMATDGLQQAHIKFFDNKFTSLVPLKIAYFMRDPENNTALDFYRVTVQVQLGIYNGVVLSWREKIRQDLPRPPSVVRSELGDTMVDTYAGVGVKGSTMIKASEWEPFIRTMPHSEFPSASACLCQVWAEQIEVYTGKDDLDPPLEFAISDTVTVKFGSWSEISEICGDSRLWGGMHFAESVPGGAELCGGHLMSNSITASIDRLIAGDETAAIFKYNPGELEVRPY